MFKAISKFSLVALILCSSGTFAGEVTDAVITKLLINKSYGETVFILVDKSKSNIPACHVNGSWTYVLSVTTELDKKMYALLLAARASQTPVTLNGSGACDVFGSIESLQTAGY
jgi:hypothetical protein